MSNVFLVTYVLFLSMRSFVDGNMQRSFLFVLVNVFSKIFVFKRNVFESIFWASFLSVEQFSMS